MAESIEFQAQTQEKRIEQQRCSKFQGTARVDLSNLQFDNWKPEQAQFLRPKNVRRLKEIFKTEGCSRLPPEHHVAAIISQQELDNSLQRSNTSQEALLRTINEEPPKLELPTARPLQCLNGQHRLQAAREFLDPGDRWWIVDLYLDGEPDQTVYLTWLN